MKNPLHPLCLRLSLALTLVASSSATVLLTDNFTVSANANDTNFDLNFPGRQGGTLATPTLSYTDKSPGGYEQVGNPETFTGNTNALLLDYGGATYLNYNFASIPSAISITFDRIIAPTGGGNTSDWLSMQVLGATTQTNGVQFGDFGILFRGNGGTQLFDHGTGSDGVSGTNTGYNVAATYTVVLSDLSGSGSAFGTNGSMVTYYEGSTLLGTKTIGQLTNGYIGFGANQIGGIDNLVIQTVPETSSLAVLGLAGGLFALRRRK